MLKKTLILILAVSLCLGFASCNKKPRYSHAELVLPLTDDFNESENDSFDASFTNGQIAVAILRISFVGAEVEGFGEALNETQFGNFWLKKCDRVADIEEYHGVSFCEYTEQAYGKSYSYLVAFYRSLSAYFVVMFATEENIYDEHRQKILEYARGVRFLDA